LIISNYSNFEQVNDHTDILLVDSYGEAIKFFWNKIINYGIILLDDYAYGEEFSEQKRSWDEFVKDKNHEILTLPTGQGLIIKN